MNNEPKYALSKRWISLKVQGIWLMENGLLTLPII